MGVGKNSNGYTILETLIFVAVSGFMFVIAAQAVSGKQGKAEFQQGMQSLNTQVRQVINDANNGHYPENASFSCNAIDPGGAEPSFSTPNKGCVYLGKVLQLGTGGTNQTGYSIYTVLGRQYVGTSDEGIAPVNFSQARPVVAPALTQRGTMEWGLKITKMTDASKGAINAIGFFGTFANYQDLSNATLESGSQSTSAVVITGSHFDWTEDEGVMATDIRDTLGGSSNIQPNPDITVCLEGGSGQYGTLKIGGGNGSRLSTNIQISNSPIGSCPA
jgi:type II secretory pathway pseudopilin PulG